MKKAILTNTIMLFLASITLAQTSTVGNGSNGLNDGLIQTTSKATSSKTDVEAPYPVHNEKKQTIIVKGTPGKGQENKEYCVFGFKKYTSGKPILNSGFKIGCRPLGERLAVNPGPIVIEYSNSSLIAEKKSNKPLEIILKRINVPYYNGKIRFNVFSDLTNSIEKEKMILMSWLFPSREFATFVCNTRGSTPEEICQMYKSKDYEQFEVKLFRFHSDASVSSLEIYSDGSYKFVNPQRRWVIDPKDGEFVSVLPGVYGIDWYDTDTKKTSTSYGI